MTEIWHGQVVDGHLGGYVPGGDPDTTYPLLWRWLVDALGVRSMLDVGCGDGGGALSFFAGRGVDVYGVDGIEQDDPRIETWDFTVGAWPSDGTPVDLVWCCEFVEHVAEEHAANFLDAFRRGSLVALTHAVPGQGGWHHVNCRESGYWIDRVEALGFRLDRDLTLVARGFASAEPIASIANYFARTGLVFRRSAR